MNTKSISLLICLLLSVCSYAGRTSRLLNGEWKFRFSHQVERNTAISVTLPHTWNAQDALSGKLDYKRGIGNYERKLYVAQELKGKRLFLRFEGANSVATLFVNGKYIGEHRGGYSAFIFEITDRVNYGKENTLLVRVNNGEHLDVMPLVGDFNFYGGIYRDIRLLVTEPLCISPLDHASPGVYLTQKSVSDKRAEVAAKICISNRGEARNVKTIIEVKDGDKMVCRAEKFIEVAADGDDKIEIPFSIEKPHLWNGRKDPFMYKAEVTLIDDGTVLDRVTQPLGLRYYRTDADKGFFLNGEHLALRGVCRHQDRAEIGNALRPEHHEEDMRLMQEMGVNAIRLAHYQQSECIYSLADEAGMVVWAEIPFVGPGGYLDKGFIDSEAFRDNGREQLRELIRQNYNHPSICFWGLFNEVKEAGDNPVEYIKELNALAHAEDPTRPTTSASNQSGAMNLITDNIAWNRYDGWYGGMPESLAKFLDNTHKTNPELRIGISEYGAGASIYHQPDSLKRTSPASYWHPENWQTFYHIENWKIISARPFVWGSFVWNMFDFGAAHRREGDRPGINDKGLVTFDRRVKKDAYYFYKANWNPEPMLHLAEKRCTERVALLQNFMVFTNAGEVELWVNGCRIGRQRPDEYKMVVWKDVPMQKGENHIRVQTVKKPNLSDEMVVNL